VRQQEKKKKDERLFLAELDSSLSGFRYLPSLDLVLLTVRYPVRFVSRTAMPLVDGSPFALAEIEWEGVGWRPQIGSKCSTLKSQNRKGNDTFVNVEKNAVGVPILSSPSHVSLLLHSLFNASIPASHLPSSRYYYDPDRPNPHSTVGSSSFRGIGIERSKGSFKDADELSGPPPPGQSRPSDAEKPLQDEMGHEDSGEEDRAEEEEDRGCWIDQQTGEPIGGADGRVEFIVVGLTIANSMLSVHGSLLDDPFSPFASATASVAADSSQQLSTNGAQFSQNTSSREAIVETSPITSPEKQKRKKGDKKKASQQEEPIAATTAEGGDGEGKKQPKKRKKRDGQEGSEAEADGERKTKKKKKRKEDVQVGA
jgi:hypothetical protein